MHLRNLEGKVCYLVGGVGVTGRGLARGLLQAGARVIVNSKHAQRLRRLQEDLNYPKGLITINRSMMPGSAAETVDAALAQTDGQLDHVVAHAAVRWRAAPSACDEMHVMPSWDTTSWDKMYGATPNLLDLTADDFSRSALQLPVLHFASAQQLVPRLHGVENASYTFVTGGEAPRGERSSLSQVNTQAVWGLAAALRAEEQPGCRVAEVRVEMSIDRPVEEREADPRDGCLSAELGSIAAGIAAHPDAEGLHRLSHMADVNATKATFPVEPVGRPLPLLWDISSFAMAL